MSELREGYKQTKVGVIPEDWGVVKLGDVLTIGSGKDYKHLGEGNIPVYGTGGYMLSVDKYLYDGESVCIGRKGTIDKPMFLTGKFWTVDTLFYTHSYKDLNPKFLYSSFLRIDWKRYNEASGVPSLSKSTIEAIKIPLPPLKEQQKIAQILSTWDDAISKQEQLIVTKETLKKGLMQRLLSGEVRFGGGASAPQSSMTISGTKVPPPEWEEVLLEELFNNIGGTALEKYTNKSSKYKFISIGNYSIDGRYIDNGQRIQLNDKTNTKLLSKNNLVMVLNDKTASGDLIGSTILINEDDLYIYNQRSERLLCKNNIVPLFAWFILNSKVFRKKIFSIAQGGTQIYVNYPSVKKLKIKLPPLKEQQKIAQVLTTADKEIELLKKEFETLKEQKRGLMQRLLTGEVRVKV